MTKLKIPPHSETRSTDSLRIVVRSAEMSRDNDEESQIAAILKQCFGGMHEGRTYCEQMPQQRLLGFCGDRLVGHLGLDYRMIRIGEAIFSVVGIIDLCVVPDLRRRGLAQRLLAAAEERSAAQDFSVLMAKDTRLYERAGYRLLTKADVTWLVIDELRSHSVSNRDLTDAFMQKPLSAKQWPKGPIDLLGFLF